jgi:hypothetical protein
MQPTPQHWSPALQAWPSGQQTSPFAIALPLQHCRSVSSRQSLPHIVLQGHLPMSMVQAEPPAQLQLCPVEAETTHEVMVRLLPQVAVRVNDTCPSHAVPQPCDAVPGHGTENAGQVCARARAPSSNDTVIARRTPLRIPCPARMKSLHRPDLYGWSRFDEARELDFNSVAWVREGGNVLVDPLELSAHDEQHLTKLGGAAIIVITNSEHRRACERLATVFGAKVLLPRAEGGTLGHGDTVVPGLVAFELHGSKTPGELALVLDGTTLITGDLIRSQRGGRLNLLPDAKLKDKAKALDSVRALLEAHPKLDAVLVGDGWPVFRDGMARLRELLG